MRVYIVYFKTYLSLEQYRISKFFDVYNYYLVSNLLNYDLIITANDFKRINRKIIRL